ASAPRDLRIADRRGARAPHRTGARVMMKPRTFPLSFAQSRLWILDRFQPGDPTYNIPAVMPLSGPIDATMLERAVHEVVRRHAALRPTFAVVDGRPCQIVAPWMRCELEIVDLSSRPSHERAAEMRRIYSEESRRGFDLARGPLVRAMLVELEPSGSAG